MLCADTGGPWEEVAEAESEDVNTCFVTSQSAGCSMLTGARGGDTGLRTVSTESTVAERFIFRFFTKSLE